MVEKFEPLFLDFVKREMQQDLAHDLNHVLRVVKVAKSLCHEEGAKLEVVVPAAYLHDCFSFPKNHPERATSSLLAGQKAQKFLESVAYPSVYFPEISHAILAHSFSAKVKPKSLEAKIVQDADRLDAIGAIGVARCLQVGTALGAGLYNAFDPFAQEREWDDRQYCVDHFYIKLLKLADTMNTASAKAEADKRTVFMKNFLTQLGNEI
ncbi:HD domain-containing protein [Enterovibrio makurazakiensis]|uniref:HD domain-containing protein n=1 Tax=Enterovibrio makurazakiensis TaxID=2910232 RepID=UPI003D259296